MMSLKLRLWHPKIGQKSRSMLVWFVHRPIDKNWSKICSRHGKILFGGQFLVEWLSMIEPPPPPLSLSLSLSTRFGYRWLKPWLGSRILQDGQDFVHICFVLISQRSFCGVLVWVLFVYWFFTGNYSYLFGEQLGRNQNESYFTGLVIFSCLCVIPRFFLLKSKKSLLFVGMVWVKASSIKFCCMS